MVALQKPTEKNAEKLPVRLVLCLDGTGDTGEGSYSAINGTTVGTKDSIRSIYDLTKAGVVENSLGKRAFQYASYFEGVGTVGVGKNASFLVRAESLFDGATGYGYLDILKNAYKVCCQRLQGGEDDEIFVFGFSRGAFISRALASFLQNVGLIKPEHMGKEGDKEDVFEKRFYELLKRYCSVIRKIKIKPVSKFVQGDELMPFCKPSPRVRLVGAFDTVKTVVPLPLHNLLFHGIPNIDFEMDAPGIVDHFRHALALNEARPLFNPDLWKSDANSPESSYLEAWFFGYHHDIGGGDVRQGLALWPLQWILHAAVEYGMVLDKTMDPYDVLFAGKDNVVETPHEIAMKMYDMICHHHVREGFGLRLNKPTSLMFPEPRSYFKSLTSPPYFQIFKPKVFLHPSAYLIFDVSSAFRIQVCEWKYFRNFLQDRATTIPANIVPWWEQQTIDSILSESSAVQHFNILVYGRPGTGKSSLISTMFGEGFTGGSRSKTLLTSGLASAHNINTPISIPGNDKVRIYLSDGFGAGGSDTQEDVERFVAKQRDTKNLEDQIHAVWYFQNSTEKKMENSEKKFFELNFGDIPTIIVLQNEDNLRDSIREALVDDEFPHEITIQRLFTKKLAALLGEMENFNPVSIVHARNPTETPKNLLSESALNFKDESIQIAQIKAQRVSSKPMVGLATEESVRAYTIWHSFKFKEKKIPFSRNENPEGLKLSWMLMEPVFATFNLRFPDDHKLILSKIGSPWSDIDKYKSGLSDKSLPGDLILICMIDTIIVMTYALSHQEINGKKKSTTDTARPLTAADVERSCAWYTAAKDNRQQETHKKIKSLLIAEDGSLVGKSIANLQMKLIEIVEFESGVAENAATGIFAAAKNLFGRFGSK